MKIYLGNKMVGKGGLNCTWFDAAAAEIRALEGVTEVFNPAEHDRTTGFNPEEFTGLTFDELAEAGFDRRAALLADWTWIGKHSNAMVAGPDWPDSPGTLSEIGCHQSLFLPVYEYAPFLKYYGTEELSNWALPPIMELGGYKPPRSDCSCGGGMLGCMPGCNGYPMRGGIDG